MFDFQILLSLLETNFISSISDWFWTLKIQMVVHLPSFSLPYGVAMCCLNNYASHCCYSSNPESMWQSLLATYFALAWRCPVERCDHSRDFNHGCKTIHVQHTLDTQARYCIVQHFWCAKWTVLRCRAPCVPYQMIMCTIILAHPMVYAHKMPIWPLQLALLLGSLCSICCFIWSRCQASYDANLKTNIWRRKWKK